MKKSIKVINLFHTNDFAAFEKAQAVKYEDPQSNVQDSIAQDAIEMQQVANISIHFKQNMGENQNNKRGIVLPIEPHSIIFDDVTYSVDTPQVSYKQITLKDY